MNFKILIIISTSPTTWNSPEPDRVSTTIVEYPTRHYGEVAYKALINAPVDKRAGRMTVIKLWE